MSVFNPRDIAAAVQELAQQFTDATGTPAALLGIEGGGVRIGVAAGVSDLEETTPAQADQTYEVGSQTKMMTAVVMLQLAEAGYVDLTRPATEYLSPADTAGIANVEAASLLELLAMRSGIPDFSSLENDEGDVIFDQIILDSDGEIVGSEAALDVVRSLPARFAPGTAYDYSNTNYILLGRVIEEVTGQDLANVFDSQIFQPLGMSDTFLNAGLVDDARLHSYTEDDEGDLVDVTELPVDLFAEGGVVSTMADMSRFMRGLLNGALLSEDSLEAMIAEEPSGGIFQDYSMYGLGLIRLHSETLGDLFGHSGGTYGTETLTFYHLQSDRVLSIADTLEDFQSVDVGMLADFAVYLDRFSLDDGPITIEGVSAAALWFSVEDGQTVISDGTVGLVLELLPDEIAAGDLIFADGSEILIGSRGDDILTSSANGAFLRGLSGDDTVTGTDQADRMAGNAGDDHLSGLVGQDTLWGGGGDDTIRGGAGADQLWGGAGDDRIHGGMGNDVIRAGRGCDRMTGGAGTDVFVFGDGLFDGVTDLDIIRDFDLSQDALHLVRGAIVDASETGQGVALTLSGTDGDAILLQGITVEMIEADGLAFV